MNSRAAEYCFSGILAGFLGVAIAEEASPLQYHSPAERREAGAQHVLADGLLLQSLAELEWEGERLHFSESAQQARHDDTALSLQLGLVAELADSLRGELIVDIDAGHRGGLDEALLEYGHGAWQLTFGRLYLSFGEYFSHFATGPIVEFAESRADAIEAGFNPGDDIDLFAYLYRSGGDNRWGVGFEGSSDAERIRFGAGYLSDLRAATSDDIMEIGEMTNASIPAWNGYLQISRPPFAVMLEMVRVADEIAGLESGGEQPGAANLEITWAPSDTLQFALRAEGSRALPEQPTERYGLSATWLVHPRFSMTADLLRGRFPGRDADAEEVLPTATEQFNVLFIVGL